MLDILASNVVSKTMVQLTTKAFLNRLPFRFLHFGRFLHFRIFIHVFQGSCTTR